MTDLILFVLGAGIAIGILVVVHEFGHFLIAKLFGVGVPVFSVGMGPRIFGFSFKGTDYRFSLLPIGGYVRMSGADPFGEEDLGATKIDPKRDFMRKPVWQRLLIMLAGPGANLVLPVLLFATLFMLGWPEFAPKLGFVSYDSPAWQAGLRTGDAIVEIEGQRVDVFRQFDKTLAGYVDTEVDLVVDRGGERHEVVLPPGAFTLDAPSSVDLDSLGARLYLRSTRLGIDNPASPAAKAGVQTFDGITAVDGNEVKTWEELLAAMGDSGAHTVDVVRGDAETGKRSEHSFHLSPDPSYTPRADDPWANPWGFVPADVFAAVVQPNKPAARAGLQPQDRLFALDGVPVHDFRHLVRLVGKSAAPDASGSLVPRELALSVVRGGELVELSMVPIIDDTPSLYGTKYRPVMGVVIASDTSVLPDRTYKSYNPIAAVGMGFEQTRQAVVNIFTALDSLVRLRSNPADMVGGPVKIFEIAGRSLAAGFYEYATTVAMISVSLAVVNLLPVPALDGGQIVVFLIEWVRGRPLSAEIRMRIQMLGVVILFALLVLATVNDVGGLLFPDP